MNEQGALRVNGSDSASGSTSGGEVASPAAREQGPQYKSGIFAKARRDGSGWGLVLVDLGLSPRTVRLSDGAVVGTASRDAQVEGEGVAAEHFRVSVRWDGCYIEDLSSPTGTFVHGVRAERISVNHGDVVRMGQKLAIFVERDLNHYVGEPSRTGTLIHGPKQRKEWIDPVFELVRGGSSVCLEGPPGIGKRSLARVAGALRESAGEVLVVDARTEAKPALGGLRPMTWVVLDAEKLPRAQQLEIAHAVGRSSGVTIIATMNMPLDRAVGDGLVAPWFASMFSGKRVALPTLETRREDIPLILKDLADKHSIELSRISPEFLECILRSGWPGGVPELESVLVHAAEQSGGGTLNPSSIATSLARSSRTKPSLPPSTDPSLARARLEDALARANGSVASAARTLGMSRQAVYREAERLGLEIARRKVAR